MIIKGDVSGDGRIGLEDLMLGQAHILEIINLSESSKKALDVSGDGQTTSRDLFLIQRHILAMEIITEIEEED